MGETDVEAETPRRFLIVGETGVGKTTTANHLSGESNQVSDNAIGVTLDYQIVFRGNTELIDTVGLSEGFSGSVHPAVAFAMLVKFAREHGEGFNGIFLIVASPRVTSSLEENYQLFVKNVAQGKVPCFLFINKQELEDSYTTQFDRNEDHYKRAGLRFADGFAGGWKTDEAREWTLQCFDNCIDSAPADKVALYKNENYWTYVNRLWRDVCRLFSGFLNLGYEEPLDDTVEGVLRKLGAPRKLAREFVSKMDSLDDQVIEDFSNKLKSNAPSKNRAMPRSNIRG